MAGIQGRLRNKGMKMHQIVGGGNIKPGLIPEKRQVQQRFLVDLMLRPFGQT